MASEAPPVAVLIAQRIAAQGIPKREVARRAHLSEGTVRRLVSPRTDIRRPPETVAAVAAVLSISPTELASAGDEAAAGALRHLLREAAGQPDVAAAVGPLPQDGDVGMATLMGEVLAGLRLIDAMDVPPRVKHELRAEFLGYLTQDAASWQRRIAALRRASQS